MQCAAGTPEDAKETLENLVPGEKYIGYVSLNHIMGYATFMAYLEKQEDLGGIWCAVDTGQYEEDRFFLQEILDSPVIWNFLLTWNGMGKPIRN